MVELRLIQVGLVRDIPLCRLQGQDINLLLLSDLIQERLLDELLLLYVLSRLVVLVYQLRLYNTRSDLLPPYERLLRRTLVSAPFISA